MNVLGVAGRAELAEMQSFVSELGLDGFEHVVDSDGVIWEQYGVTSQPAFAFLGADGSTEVVIAQFGEERLTERVQTLLNG